MNLTQLPQFHLVLIDFQSTGQKCRNLETLPSENYQHLPSTPPWWPRFNVAVRRNRRSFLEIGPALLGYSVTTLSSGDLILESISVLYLFLVTLFATWSSLVPILSASIHVLLRISTPLCRHWENTDMTSHTSKGPGFISRHVDIAEGESSLAHNGILSLYLHCISYSMELFERKCIFKFPFWVSNLSLQGMSHVHGGTVGI